MKLIFKLSLIKCFLVIAVVFTAMPVFASEFNFDTQNKTVRVEEQFKVDLNINTEKENINAVEGKIIFPADFLELSEIRDGNSVVNFWVDKPTFTDGTVFFSGITPGGYILDKGLIFSLIFKAKKEGDVLIKIENASALKNDGNGTKTILKTPYLKINIFGIGQKQENNSLAIVDKELPDIFQPEMSRDPNIFNNRWFVVFAAQDKDSGIAKYEVKESKYNIFNFSKWIVVESPYVLTDQNLRSGIFVKAIDNAGNERIVKLSPKNPVPWYANLENWFIIALVIAVTFIFFFLFKNVKNKNEII